jgi:WD40 repeat protein
MLPETLNVDSIWHRCSVSGDGARVVLSIRSLRKVQVYDLFEGSLCLERSFDPSEELTTNDPDISWDGNRLVTGDFGYSGAVEVWQVSPPFCLSRFFPHRGNLRPLSLSADGNKILVSSSDTTARLWDSHGTPMGPLLQHARFCDGGELATDGRQAVTWERGVGAKSSVVYLWDSVTGDRLGRWPIPFWVGTCWFSSDTKILWIIPQHGSAVGLIVEPLNAPAELIPQLIDLVTGQRIEINTEGVEYLPLDTFVKSPESYLRAWRTWRGLGDSGK